MSDNRRTADPANVELDVDENLLERWSRRKEMARQGKPLPEPDEAPDILESRGDEYETDAASEPGDRPIVQDAEVGPPELPPVESLGEDSDYSAFMASDVSPDLRRQALRKLFHSPKFNVRDGLDDYDLDYSNPEPLGNIVTAEMRRRILREIERMADADDDAADAKVALTEDVSDAEARVTTDPTEAQTEGAEDADDDRPAAS